MQAGQLSYEVVQQLATEQLVSGAGRGRAGRGGAARGRAGSGC